MIKIYIPNNNLEERKYILNVMFFHFLGLEYELHIEETLTNWKIELENNTYITFEDHFFSQYIGELEYLEYKNLPIISYQKQEDNPYLNEEDIPIIYGKSILNTNEYSIKCGIDIFASSFFMLTRWEEFVNSKLDKHHRFSSFESIAFKNQFIFRPIVNEYLEMLKNMLLKLDGSLTYKSYKSQTIISCDVDDPFDCTVENLKSLTRAVLGDLIKRRSLKLFLQRIRKYIFNKFGNYKYDESYTFHWYMDICEKAGLKCAFYFLADNSEENNGCYNLNDKKIKRLLKYIDNRGHEIGIHGTYQSFNNLDKAKAQKQRLESYMRSLNISQKVIGNRQHYLRWDSSITPSILNSANFEYDTTGCYADMPGFRYGICYEFPMFDFLNRKLLKLKQRPLVVMECTVLSELYLAVDNYEEAFKVIIDLKNKCFQYNGIFSLLWHNNYFNTNEDKVLFESIVGS